MCANSSSDSIPWLSLCREMTSVPKKTIYSMYHMICGQDHVVPYVLFMFKYQVKVLLSYQGFSS